MTRVKFIIPVLALAFALCSCGGRGGSGTVAEKPFPMVQVPSVMAGDEAQVLEYLAEHYFDLWIKGPQGVPPIEVDQAVANYVAVLDLMDVPAAAKCVGKMFAKAEGSQLDSAQFFMFAGKLEHYLYDPNSPERNEDFYLPVVKTLAHSPRTPENLREQYSHTAQMCSLNRYGDVAPDFEAVTADGRVFSLHEIEAQYTMLFFSNPGCAACKEIVDAIVDARDLERWIAEGRLAIVNIYIDQEVDKWREYEPDYPRSWITGYDCEYKIREDILYNVRAIPSLYLLDSGKRVLLKDAPTEKTIQKVYLELQKR